MQLPLALPDHGPVAQVSCSHCHCWYWPHCSLCCLHYQLPVQQTTPCWTVPDHSSAGYDAGRLEHDQHVYLTRQHTGLIRRGAWNHHRPGEEEKQSNQCQIHKMDFTRTDSKI